MRRKTVAARITKN